ncbi:hypothetical protein HK101_008132 [Irineochytrium annulatum]|nr:hypothetical protein HK101_008132 [Irineochytrium annulatum]
MSADQRASYPYFTHQQLLQQRGGLYIPPFDRAAYEAELLRQKMQGMKVEEVPAADEMIDDDDEYDDDGLEEEEEDEVVRERRNSSAMMVDVVPSNAANADPAAGPGTVKPKRKRASPHQVRVLQSVFDATAFPSTEHRQRLAHELGMTPRAVQIWFQNKRQGLKVKKEAGGDRRSTSPKPSPMIVPSSSPSESSPASSAYSLNSSARSSPSLAGSPGPANAAQLHPNLKSATSLVARMHGRGHRRSRTASSLEDMKRASTSVTQSAIAAQHLAQQQQAPWVTNPPIIPSSLARADDKEKLAASAMMTMMGEATPMAGVNQGRSEGHAQPEPRPQQQVPSQGQQLPGIKEMLRGIGSGV